MTSQNEMIGHFHIIRNRAAEAASANIRKQRSPFGTLTMPDTSSSLLCTKENTSTGSRGGEEYSPSDTNRVPFGTRLDQSGPLREQNMSNNISQKQYLHGRESEESDNAAMSVGNWNKLVSNQMTQSTMQDNGSRKARDWCDHAPQKIAKPEGNLRLSGNTKILTSSGYVTYFRNS